MSAPLKWQMSYLTSDAEFDILHRRAGRDARPKVVAHADAHKYCPLGRCGNRPGPYAGGNQESGTRKVQKIVSWRKAKAAENRRYLEEKVYARTERKEPPVVYHDIQGQLSGSGWAAEHQSADGHGC